jgi:adenine-specific DNA methylase
MKFMANESARKLRGGYYTPGDLADYLTRWVLQADPMHILEPACGDGVFFAALGRRKAAGVQSITGCEIDPCEAAKARQRGRTLGPRLAVHACDFLQWSLSRLASPVFDAVLGNPPYIRYQYLPRRQQDLAAQMFEKLGLAFTRHTNAWVPFVAASLALLRPGGRLGMVIPAELLHVLHAGSLRRYLLAQCSEIVVLDLTPLSFVDALQGVVLLLATRRASSKTRPCDLAIVTVENHQALILSGDRARAEFFPTVPSSDKWMFALLTARERSLLTALRGHDHIVPVRALAEVDVGIVTGANKFFLVTEATVRQHQLRPWARPMFGRSEHVPGVIYDRRTHEANRRRGLPAHFLWFRDTPLAQLPAPVRCYLCEGQRQGLHRRYKCRIRQPWFNVPSVSAAPVAMLKRCHHFPRLVLNTARAFTTDTAYRIRPRQISAAGLVFAFINSLTALCSELEGRHYGGGVLELVPSEIERLLLPRPRAARAALKELDQAIRTGLPPATILTMQNRQLLHPLGLTREDCALLLHAWRRLRDRRHRDLRTGAAVLG